MIFNLNTHDLPGSHWVAVLGDSSTGLLAFFNSYGKLPKNRYRSPWPRLWSKGYLDLMARDHDDTGVERDSLPIQGFACGLYSLYRIITLLHSDQSVKTFNNHRCQKIDDETMNRSRKAWYIDEKK